MKNFYEMLDIPKDASADEIKKAYRRLAKIHHPDRNQGDKKAEERFKEISVANEILSNPEKRALYDEFGEESLLQDFDADIARSEREARRRPREEDRSTNGHGGFDPADIPWTDQGNLDVEAIFEQMFDGIGGFGRKPRAKKKVFQGKAGQSLEQMIPLTLEETMTGIDRLVTLERPNGENTQVRVKIPRGVKEGDKIRLAGQGMPGSYNTISGDMLLVVAFRPHPIYRVQEMDLSLDLPITLPEAVLGASIEIPTLDGPVTMRLPPGTSSGKKLRLAGKGLLDRKNREARGDLYAVIQVQVPEISPRLRELAEAMVPLYGNVRKNFGS